MKTGSTPPNARTRSLVPSAHGGPVVENHQQTPKAETDVFQLFTRVEQLSEKEIKSREDDAMVRLHEDAEAADCLVHERAGFGEELRLSGAAIRHALAKVEKLMPVGNRSDRAVLLGTYGSRPLLLSTRGLEYQLGGAISAFKPRMPVPVNKLSLEEVKIARAGLRAAVERLGRTDDLKALAKDFRVDDPMRPTKLRGLARIAIWPFWFGANVLEKVLPRRFDHFGVGILMCAGGIVSVPGLAALAKLVGFPGLFYAGAGLSAYVALQGVILFIRETDRERD